MVEEKFLSKISNYNDDIVKYKKEFDRIGYLRLIVMILALYFTYRGVRDGMTSKVLFFSLIFYGAFVCLIIYHRKVKGKLKLAEDMIEINNRYLQRISGEWINFQDLGDEFVNKDHRYASDLDIVGKESLFQLINITNTWHGRESLAKALLEPNYDRAEILLRQEAVKELFDDLDFCEEMERIGKNNKNGLKNPKKLISYVEDKGVLIKSKFIKKVLYLMPLFTIPISLIIFIFNLNNLNFLMYFLLIIQTGVWVISTLKVNQVLENINYFRGSLEEYLNILRLIEKKEFKSKKLNDIKENLFKYNGSAIEAIKKLSSISEKINIRQSNGLIYIALNILFLWDYQCVFSLEDWKAENGDKIENWLSNIGVIEELMSLAVLVHIDENVAFPTINPSGAKIEAQDLGHPLISKDVRVNNDVSMKENIFIITGSNMSGKTTFLRTIGINLVLAYVGAPVFSKKMECSLLDIYTSMRITDDLKNGISTFYGELIRIKEIIEGAKNNKNMIFLIDEIFRGTNSKDRITGADAVIRNLSKAGVIGGLTTHDVELCNLSECSGIKNYHFSEYYKENKIYFDYKLKVGKSNTTNAKYLMRIVGIEI
ncbi:DNA mismatch repair protein MutS [Clostridium sp.]|uniref:MutS-related protein n=1 Tax=Clostridium sp. TaxID=1506 RepID=UPI0034643B53